jgi:FKBP-type peptidyl-prolyl cis-trans isomerase
LGLRPIEASHILRGHFAIPSIAGISMPSSLYRAALVAGLALLPALAGCAGDSQARDQSSKSNSTAPVTATSNSIPKKADLPDLPTGAGPMDPDAPEEFTRSKSGLYYRILRKSNGPRPHSTDRVLADYKGWLNNGQQFDSSYEQGKPSEFALNGVVAGWTEGLQLIGEGGMIELEVPPRLGYSAMPHPGIPPNSTLHFIVELKEIR